jgi:hypothetical protein
MRLFVVNNETSVSAVTERVAGISAAASEAERLRVTRLQDEIRRVNPRIDFDRLAAGDVIVIPDSPDVAADAGEKPLGSFFDLSAEQATENLKQLERRVREGASRTGADRAALTKLLGSAEVKRALGNQEALIRDVERIRESIKADDKEMATRLKQLDTTLTAVANDLKSLPAGRGTTSARTRSR